MEKGVLVKQKHFNMGFFAVWIMVITTVQWIMLDLYLPALPVLREEFGVSESLLNISINVGIAMCAIGTFIGGILSDRFGRKPLTVLGLLVGGICSFLCAFSHGVLFLSIMRGISGFGSGFVLSITVAIIKDSFTGTRFDKNMTILQSVAVIGPIIAPSLGSFIVNELSWRYIFIFLGAAVLITMVPMLFMTETWPQEKRTATSFLLLLKSTGRIAKDKSFMLFMGITSFLTIPVWAYISVSSYVYLTEFRTGYTVFSILYAAGAAASFCAPFLYLIVTRKCNMRKAVHVAVGVLLAGSLILLLAGKLSPVVFLAGVVCLMISEGMIRPLGMVVLLEEHKDQAGAASAFMQFIVNIVGVIGTSIATIGWESDITGVGIVAAGCAIGGIVCWIPVLKKEMFEAFK